MKEKIFFIGAILSCLLFVSNHLLAKEIKYSVSMPEPQTHYLEVDLELTGFNEKQLDIKMPAWAPGSYLVRDFAKNVDFIKVVNEKGEEIKIFKTDKNTWRIQKGSSSKVKISYHVYAFENSVRTSFVDIDHAFISGTSVFMFVDGYLNQPAELEIIPYKEWNVISTGLQKIQKDGWYYQVDNYDQLADSPLEIGNQKEIKFEAAGIPHIVAMYGDGNYDEEAIISDFTKIIEKCTEIFGDNPNKKYVFIIHNQEKSGGGLEHMNSTTIKKPRWNYGSEQSYESFLTTVAHEYFHLWLVKRVRPEGLGPFDYEKEVYTDQLWIMEGFTAYFSQLILCQLGYIENHEFINFFADRIINMEASSGTRTQSISEASFDAWIKAYQTNENSGNVTISYYVKGSVIANLIDLMIIDHSNGEKDLGDAMKYLYDNYYLKNGKAISGEEFKAVFEQFSGQNLDEFYNKYVYGTEEIDYDHYLSLAGLSVTKRLNINTELKLGVRTSDSGGKLIVKSVTKDGPGWKYGLNTNDEIIAIDGYRVSYRGISTILKNKMPEDVVDVLISRDGVIKTIQVKLHPTSNYYYYISRMEGMNNKHQKVYVKWLDDK